MNNLLQIALVFWCWSVYAELKERTVTVSNVVYIVRYEVDMNGPAMVPLTNPLGQSHYPCTATVWNGTNRCGTPIDTQWTEHGCFEDDPLSLVGRSLAWTRYPDNSAGAGHHWIIIGSGMTSEADNEQVAQADREMWARAATNRVWGTNFSMTNVMVIGSGFEVVTNGGVMTLTVTNK